jgi:hypothetical protein
MQKKAGFHEAALLTGFINFERPLINFRREMGAKLCIPSKKKQLSRSGFINRLY